MKREEGELQQKQRKTIEYTLGGEVLEQKYEEWKVLINGRIKKFIVPKYTNYEPGDYIAIEYEPIPNYTSYYDFLFYLYKKTGIRVRSGGIIASGIAKRVRNANF